MDKRHSLSIRAYIILPIVILVVVQIGLVVFSSIQQRNYDYKASSQLAIGLGNEVRNNQNVLLSGSEQFLSCLSFIPCVLNRDAQATTVLLKNLVKKSPGITNILVADTTGLVWASALPMRGVIMANDRRFFKNAMATGNFSSGEFTIGRVLNQPAISFGYPIKDSSGKIRDIAIIAFTLSQYNDLLKIKKMPDFNSLVLTDHKGTILFDANGPQFIGKKDKDEIFKRMSEGPDKGTFEAVGITGKKRFFAYQKLYVNTESTPYMYVRAGVLKDAVVRSTRNNLMINISIMGTIMFLSIGIAFYYSKRGILDKITSLREATQNVADGNLDISVSECVSGGELGELGHSFEEMARKLADDIAAREQVEAALKEKSQMLVALNDNLEFQVHKAVEEIRQKDQMLIQQNRLAAMGDMINNIAHQWRQPLNNVGLTIQSIRADFLTGNLTRESLEEEVNQSMQSIRYMSQTIDDFRSYFRPDKEKQSFRIIKVVKHVISLIHPTLQNHGIELRLVDDNSKEVMGYENEFGQVLINVINNAKDAIIERKPADPFIEILCFQDGERSVVTVKDNAGGIDQSIISKIFDPYFTTKFQSQGTGIGLYMSKIIIEMNMGGHMSVKNSGDGAEFRIEI